MTDRPIKWSYMDHWRANGPSTPRAGSTIARSAMPPAPRIADPDHARPSFIDKRQRE